MLVTQGLLLCMCVGLGVTTILCIIVVLLRYYYRTCVLLWYYYGTIAVLEAARRQPELRTKWNPKTAGKLNLFTAQRGCVRAAMEPSHGCGYVRACVVQGYG